MNDMRVIIAIVLAMLGLERLVVVGASRSARGKALIRKIPLFHPNGISLMRLPMGVISISLAFMGYWVAATLWFSFWMITDLSDGTIARHCDLGTETGKWLDPLSDKCMYFPALFFFALSDAPNIHLDIIPVAVFALFDILGQASRLFVEKKAANHFGKAKTALVTVLLSIMALNQIDDFVLVNERMADAMMYSCVILAFLSAYCKIIPDKWYANTLTFANFICGLVAIWYAFNGAYIHCVVLVFVGQFFDLFDGRMARKYGSTKRGPLFDDIADATSFGIAIGLMVFFCLKNEERMVNGLFAGIIALIYVGCLFFRLYRFLRPTCSLPPGVFQGLPSPAGAMFAGSSVLVALEFEHPVSGLIAACCVLLSAGLMVSNIKYSHFGQIIMPNMSKALKLLMFVVFTIFTAFAVAQKMYRPSFIWFCFGVTLIYLICGIQRINKLQITHKEDCKCQ